MWQERHDCYCKFRRKIQTSLRWEIKKGAISRFFTLFRLKLPWKLSMKVEIQICHWAGAESGEEEEDEGWEMCLYLMSFAHGIEKPKALGMLSFPFGSRTYTWLFLWSCLSFGNASSECFSLKEMQQKGWKQLKLLLCPEPLLVLGSTWIWYGQILISGAN